MFKNILPFINFPRIFFWKESLCMCSRIWLICWINWGWNVSIWCKFSSCWSLAKGDYSKRRYVLENIDSFFIWFRLFVIFWVNFYLILVIKIFLEITLAFRKVKFYFSWNTILKKSKISQENENQNIYYHFHPIILTTK